MRFFAIATLCAASLCASETQDRSLLEAKAGYFFFSNPTMRRVYDEGGIDAQLSYSLPVGKWVQLYESVEYFQKFGHSLQYHEGTKIRGVTLSFAVKPVFKIASILDFYVGIGPRYFFLHMDNDSSFVDRNISKNGLGGFAITGFLLRPLKNWTFDFFGEASYKNMDFKNKHHRVVSKSTQVGGFAFGGGFGYLF